MHRILFSRGRPARHQWAWSYSDRCGIVTSNTRSEARAAIKAALGLASSERLPLGTTLLKIDA